MVADRFAVTDLGPQLDDFLITAAVMNNLDLVITADTADRPSGRGPGGAGVGGPARGPRLAVAAGTGRQPLVSHHATVPPGRRGDWEGVFQRMADALKERVVPTGCTPAMAVEISPGELIE